MKFISKRISASVTKESASIVITSDKESLKQSLLFTWIVFWSLSGIIILTQLFGTYNREEKIFMFLWMLFWLYFEYVGVYAWLWKEYGYEKLVFKDEMFFYQRNVKGRARIIAVNKKKIQNVAEVDDSGGSVLSYLNNSYWIIGGERIVVDYDTKKIKLGMKLNREETTEILKWIKKHVSNKTLKSHNEI